VSVLRKRFTALAIDAGAPDQHIMNSNDPKPPEIEPPQPPPPKRKTAWLALAILFVPAVLMLLCMIIGYFGPDMFGVEIAIAIGGSSIAGIICGILLGGSGKTVSERILFCILLVPIMIIVSFMLCFFSCALIMGRHITGG
jgi:hypothetical protein